MHCSLKSSGIILELKSRSYYITVYLDLTPWKRIHPFNCTFAEFGYAGIINQALFLNIKTIEDKSYL